MPPLIFLIVFCPDSIDLLTCNQYKRLSIETTVVQFERYLNFFQITFTLRHIGLFSDKKAVRRSVPDYHKITLNTVVFMNLTV